MAKVLCIFATSMDTCWTLFEDLRIAAHDKQPRILDMDFRLMSLRDHLLILKTNHQFQMVCFVMCVHNWLSVQQHARNLSSDFVVQMVNEDVENLAWLADEVKKKGYFADMPDDQPLKVTTGAYWLLLKSHDGVDV